MKRIGLIDVDSHNYPNLVLMKLSAWHTWQGNQVEWYNPLEYYDVVYMSKVFTFSPDYKYQVNADHVIKGGTGYAIHGAGGEDYNRKDDLELPYEVEHIMPDYNLYGIKDTAYGFLTRGCPRCCSFCIVSKKEGRCSRKVANLSEFWRDQKNIVLYDPNILACREWHDLLGQLADSGAMVDFNQGLDARLLTEEKCRTLNCIRINKIQFAWDIYEDRDRILPKLEMFADICKGKVHKHNAVVYVLVNYNSTLEQDLDRIYTLRNLGYWAYVMVYDKKNAPHIYTDLQRWCNNRFVFARCPRFDDYGKTEKSIDKHQLTLF